VQAEEKFQFGDLDLPVHVKGAPVRAEVIPMQARKRNLSQVARPEELVRHLPRDRDKYAVDNAKQMHHPGSKLAVWHGVDSGNPLDTVRNHSARKLVSRRERALALSIVLSGMWCVLERHDVSRVLLSDAGLGTRSGGEIPAARTTTTRVSRQEWAIAHAPSLFARLRSR
jgi:hypothetical protein